MSNAPTNYIELRRKRDFSDVLSTAFQFIRLNWKSLYRSLLFICLPIYLVASLLIGQFFRTGYGVSTSVVGAFSVPLGYLLYFFAMLLLYAIIYEYMAFYMENGGATPSTAQIWQRTRGKLFKYFGIGLISAVIVLLGFLLFAIPGIWAAVVLSLAFPVLAFRPGTLGESLGYPFRLIRGRWWLTFGLILVITMLIGFISYIIYLPFMLAFGFGAMSSTNWATDPDQLGWFISLFTVLAGMVNVLLQPFVNATIGVHALSLMEETEGLGLLDRVDSMTAEQAG